MKQANALAALGFWSLSLIPSPVMAGDVGLATGLVDEKLFLVDDFPPMTKAMWPDAAEINRMREAVENRKSEAALPHCPKGGHSLFQQAVSVDSRDQSRQHRPCLRPTECSTAAVSWQASLTAPEWAAP